MQYYKNVTTGAVTANRYVARAWIRAGQGAVKIPEEMAKKLLDKQDSL